MPFPFFLWPFFSRSSFCVVVLAFADTFPTAAVASITTLYFIDVNNTTHFAWLLQRLQTTFLHSRQSSWQGIWLFLFVSIGSDAPACMSSRQTSISPCLATTALYPVQPRSVRLNRALKPFLLHQNWCRRGGSYSSLVPWSRGGNRIESRILHVGDRMETVLTDLLFASIRLFARY